MSSKQVLFRAQARKKVLLSGGVAVIRVGAPSEVELQNKKEAFDDAISATKAAMAEGIVPGGGLALLRALEPVAAEAKKCEGDERTGLFSLQRALEVPVRQLSFSPWQRHGKTVPPQKVRPEKAP